MEQTTYKNYVCTSILVFKYKKKETNPFDKINSTFDNIITITNKKVNARSPGLLLRIYLLIH